jgi:hypothetical protein
LQLLDVQTGKILLPKLAAFAWPMSLASQVVAGMSHGSTLNVQAHGSG